MQRLLLCLHTWPQLSSMCHPHLPLPMQRLPPPTVLMNNSRTCANALRKRLRRLRCLPNVAWKDCPSQVSPARRTLNKFLRNAQTNTTHSFAWDHEECDSPGPRFVPPYATRLHRRFDGVDGVRDGIVWAGAWQPPILSWVPAGRAWKRIFWCTLRQPDGRGERMFIPDDPHRRGANVRPH